MDISKLPRLSKTDTPTPDPAAPGASAAAPVDDAPAAPIPFVTASAWCPNCGAPLAPASRFCNSCGARIGAPADAASAGGGVGIEGWISIGVGLFLMFMSPWGVQYWLAKLTGREFTPYDPPPGVEGKVAFQRFQDMNTGAISDIYYRDTPGFWSDSAVTAFAVVLILDGLVLALVRRPAAVLATFVATLLATLFNLGYLLYSFNSAGFAPISFLAVLFGGFMCFHQWQTLQWMRATAGVKRAVV